MFKKLAQTATRVLVASALLSATSAYAQEVRVGGKNFTEQLLVAEITNQFLTAKGMDVEKRDGMGTSVLRAALENDQLDVYWEYTGTSLVTFNKVEDKLSAEDTYNKVKELDAKVGITWLNPSAANSTYAIAVRASDDKGLSTISDMAAAYNGDAGLKFGVNAEFPKRPDGLPGMEEAYGFDVARKNLAPMQTGLIYQALKDEQLDIGLVFALDGRIQAFDFKVLADDKEFFPNYALTPNIRTEYLDANPEVGTLLNTLSAVFTDEIVRDLCARVDVDKKTVEDVSAAFLAEQGLI